MPSGSSLEFEVVGDRNNFIDLQKIYLEIKCRILQTSGTYVRYTNGDANASDLPYFANNILHSLFADYTVSAYDIKISTANGHYALKSLIETQFSHGTDTKKTWLKFQGYEYKKNPGTIPAAISDIRKRTVRQSARITLYGKLRLISFHVRNIWLMELHYAFLCEDLNITLSSSARTKRNTTRLKRMRLIYLSGR